MTTQISIKNVGSRDKKVIIAVPVDNLTLENDTLVACFMEMDMDNMLKEASLQSNNNTTFCNIYTAEGIALTDMVLGGLASEDNLIDAMSHAEYENGYSHEKLVADFKEGHDGAVSFTYNGIKETLYYVPISETNWMLTYLIRESVIAEQISSISKSIIVRSLIQSVLTAVVLIAMFIFIILQQRRSAKATLEAEIAETENRIKQQELEEQLAMQEELTEQAQARSEQQNMITALSSDYRSVYYVDLDKDEAICYRKDVEPLIPIPPGQNASFLKAFTDYGNNYVAERYREEFFRFINPANIKKALEKQLVISYSYLRIKDGEESYEILKMARVRHPKDRTDHMVHAVGVGFADIDAQMRESMARAEELAQALKDAEAASKVKSSFVSNMSHEIRTPITAILGMNEMIRRESGDEDIISYADNINKAGISLLGIISDILDFSKIEAGRMEITEGKYMLSGLLNDLYNLIRFRSETKGIDFLIKAEASIPKGLVGDELRVKQIIANLLTNAVKYTEKGSVTLEVKCLERKDGKAKISVSVTDTGIGIKEEEMDRLFSPFERLDVARTRSVEGSGLGMAITRQLLGYMGSDLSVKSKYNEGSVFSFELWQGVFDETPIGEFKPDVSAGEHDNRPGRVFTAPGKKILVVDDMPMNLQVITGLLKRTQMVIDTAASGDECIKKFGEKDYDIVFLDYRMPVLDGIETLRKLKEIYPEKAAKIPIVSLTASAIVGDREKLLAAGFTDYLSKPINIADMEGVVSKYLKGDFHDETATAVQVSPEENEIPKGILCMVELDCDKGLEYCGDADDYVFALETFSESCDEKCSQIEEALKSGNTEEYVLLTHSLKSMSKSVGALDLSEMARVLEMSGREEDKDKMTKDTPAFIEAYKELCNKIRGELP